MKRTLSVVLGLIFFCAGFWVDGIDVKGPKLLTISEAEAGPYRRTARRTARRTSRRTTARHNAYHYRPYVGGVAVATAATAIAVGTIAATLPPSCHQVRVNGRIYHDCSGTWYEPRYNGPELVYVVVENPH